MYSSTCFTCLNTQTRGTRFLSNKAFWMRYLFSVLSPGWIQALDQIRGVSQEQRVTCRARNHGEHGQPHVGQWLGRKSPITNTEHMGHGFEQRPWVLFQPIGLLQTIARHLNSLLDTQKALRQFGNFLTLLTCNSLIATHELAGNAWSMGTRNWRHPDQCPISSIMQMRLKIRMKTLAILRNWNRKDCTDGSWQQQCLSKTLNRVFN